MAQQERIKRKRERLEPVVVSTIRTTRQRLNNVLRDIGKGRLVSNPDEKSNLGTALHNIFIWQEIVSEADKELKRAWKTAQAKDGICEDDDRLRELGVGESEVCNSKHYALMVDVKTPAQRIDNFTFYTLLARQFNTSVAEIERLAESCKVENKASLTKKVVERI